VSAGYTEFEFDLPEALLARLVEVFEDVEPAQLLSEIVGNVPEEQGVYQLFLKREGVFELVYIGKTDAAAGLHSRLARHAGKIQQRIGLDPRHVYFKAVRVYVFTAVDLETQLINHYGGVLKVNWNGSGFGSNDPGKERDTTTYKVDHFDTQFPIDIALPLLTEIPTVASAATILRTLKRDLPYLIRFELLKKGSRLAHPDLEFTIVTLDPARPLTPEQIIAQTVRALPAGWHATMLPSHIIIYKDDSRRFPSGRLIQRSGSV
jgi:hypothetical protein